MPHNAPAKVATMRPLRKNSNSKGRSSSSISAPGPLAEWDHISVVVVIEHDGHSGVLENLHTRPVGPLQDFGRERLTRRALPDDLGVEADDIRKMAGDPVQIVRREQDGKAEIVQVVEQMEDVVTGSNVDVRS